MQKKLLVVIALLVVVTFGGGWFFATPYLSVWNLERAAAAGDAAGIAEHVDFDALRPSLQIGIQQKINDTVAALPDNALTRLGASLASTLAQTAVNNATPETVALLFKGVRPGGTPSEGSDVDVSMGYSAFGHFIVDVKQKTGTDGPIELLFTRYGLASWKLTSVRFT